MNKYNYQMEVYCDVDIATRKWFKENGITPKCGDDLNKYYDALYDKFFFDNEITGNGEGLGFYPSRIPKEEMLCGNVDLALTAYKETCDAIDPMESFVPDAIDVIIRCYLLGPTLKQVLCDIETELKEENGKEMWAPSDIKITEAELDDTFDIDKFF